jgi:hypothetical protein
MRPITKLSMSVAAAAFALLTALAPVKAHAGIVDWTLSGVTFNDGGTASGTFVTDGATGKVQSWDIATAGGLLTPETYDSVFPGPFFGGSQTRGFVVFANDGSGQKLELTGSSPLVATNSLSVLRTTNSLETDGATTRNVSVGDVVVDAPEPMSMALLGVGLIGLAICHRRSGGRRGPLTEAASRPSPPPATRTSTSRA